MAVGLEIFLIPNHVIDGGITGISIMLSHLTGLNLGIFLFLLNLPFFSLSDGNKLEKNVCCFYIIWDYRSFNCYYSVASGAGANRRCIVSHSVWGGELSLVLEWD
ncbi:hypothetical protein GCM10020331_037250 [Ectobacillus funiculus]